MALTKIQIISLALNKIGKASINSIGNSDIEVAADNLYNALLNSEFTTGTWRFAVRILPLSLTTDVPPVQSWKYIYQLPADYGKMVRLHPMTYSFEIFQGGLLYSNLSPLDIEYVSTNMNALLLPGYFYMYFISQIAAWLAPGNAQNPQLYSLLQDEANDLRKLALAVDAQNRPSKGIVSAPIIDSRFCGGYENGIGLNGWG
jgi:hypothetical protein